jgi:hypothetical protein
MKLQVCWIDQILGNWVEMFSSLMKVSTWIMQEIHVWTIIPLLLHLRLLLLLLLSLIAGIQISETLIPQFYWASQENAWRKCQKIAGKCNNPSKWCFYLSLFRHSIIHLSEVDELPSNMLNGLSDTLRYMYEFSTFSGILSEYE